MPLYMNTFEIGGKTVSVFPSAEPAAPIIYLNTFSGEGQKVWETIHTMDCLPFSLVAVSNLNWNHDMVPWDSPPAFKNGDPCTGGADDYLRLLTEKMIPMAEKKLSAPPQWRGITGYSLAGLFALYAIYQTDVFSRAGSMSGSLWFPGIKEYVVSREPKRWPDRIYFSLGDKECKTRNPMLKNVRQNTEDIYTFYKAKGITTLFQLNQGNHYNHAVERTAAGLCWLINGTTD